MKSIAALLAATALGLSASAAPWPDFQREGHGLSRQGDRLGALGFQLTLRGWPRLGKSAVPYYADGIPHGYGKRIATFDLGAIMAEGQPKQAPGIEKDWAHAVVSVADSLKLYTSRLTPAVVIEYRGGSVHLLAGEKSPAPIGFATAKGVVEPGDLPKAVLKDGDWLLAWFGSRGGFRSTRLPYCYDGRGWMPGPTATVDCPLLLVFPQAPARLEMGPKGLAVSRDDLLADRGRVVLMPLLGDWYPPTSQTDRWAAGLPGAIQKQCQWWAEHLAEVPQTASETYAYDEKSDTIAITTKVRFLKLRDGGKRLAPLAPILALAQEHGFSVELSGPVARTSVLTAIGPYAGVEGGDEYTCKVAGLGKYVLETRMVEAAPREPERLAKMLREEVAKVVEAGHLAPWYPAINVYGAGYRTYLMLAGTLAWANPGETLHLLGEALPLVEQPMQGRLLAYLKRERADFPPEKTAVLRAEEGARRERWRLEPAEIQEILLEHNRLIDQSNFYKTNALVPEENVYYLAEYARRTGAEDVRDAWPEIRKMLYPYLARQDWATLGWYRWPGKNSTFDGLGGVVDAGHHFAALVGAIRLARAASDDEGEQLLWGHFARAAILRHALGRYAAYLHKNRFVILPADPGLSPAEFLDHCGEIATTGKVRSLFGRPDWMAQWFSGSWTGRLVTYHWTSAADDVRSVVRLDEFGVLFDEVLVEYAGKGLLAYRGLTPELARFLADRQQAEARTLVDRVAEHMPDWYLAYPTANLGAEFNYLAPENGYQCFLARAWILQEPPGDLARLLDVAWMERGDLYFIHKLTETIRAHRGVKWVRIAP